MSVQSNACDKASNTEPLIAEKYRKLVMLAGITSVSTAILLMIMKFIVWLFSGSATILASLTDSMIDLGASFINLLALRYALTPADKDHRFGHYKAEALASLSQAAFICGSALLLMINGYDRLVKPQEVAYVSVAIYVSIASIILTICLTSFQTYVYKATGSEAIAADRFHYISDIGLNISVIISLVLTSMGYAWADGLVAILLGLYIMRSSVHIGRVAINTLLDRSLTAEENNQIMSAILSVEGIDSLHDLRTRRAGPQHYIQCHIVLDKNMPLYKAHDIANEAEKNILAILPDADISLHMEPEEEDTFKDITFVDHIVCSIPKDHYNKHKQSISDSQTNLTEQEQTTQESSLELSQAQIESSDKKEQEISESKAK